jgi:hypothetical protein
MARLSPRWLTLFLKVVGAVTMTAFAAAVMPQAWIVNLATWLGFDPFPSAPLTFYLARNLSLMYGFIGMLVLWIAIHIDQYRSLVRPFGYATVLFGISQAIVDAQAAMPVWWTALESLSTIFGGIVIVWLDHVTLGNSTTESDSPSADPSAV